MRLFAIPLQLASCAQLATQHKLHRSGGAPIEYAVEVVQSFAHPKPVFSDGTAGQFTPFTQGLERVDCETFVETSGSYPATEVSYLRTGDWNTGATIKLVTEGLQERFVEGITRVEDGWMASTYQDGKAVRYGPDFDHDSGNSQTYPLDGWGFTYSSARQRIFATDGSAKLYTLDPTDVSNILDVTEATSFGMPLKHLNELEFVDEFDGGAAIMGNVYGTRLVAMLDPESKECTGVFSLEDLSEDFPEAREAMGYHVANGIAKGCDDTYLVTGKNWENMYQIRLTRSTERLGVADQLNQVVLGNHPSTNFLQISESNAVMGSR